MNRHFATLTGLLLVLVILLAACAPSATPQPTAVPTTVSTAVPTTVPTTVPAAAALTLTDGLGRSVTLAEVPARIVSLAPSNTEILFALGAGDRVVGRDEFSDTPAEAKEIASVGGSMGKYDLEAIASLNPDLVLAAEINTPEQIQALEDLGLTVFYLSNPTDLPGLYTNLTTVGQLVGEPGRAAELVTSLQTRVEAVTAKLAGVTDRPVVYYELDATDLAKPYTAGPGTFIDQLIGMAGGQNLGGSLDAAWAQVSAEEIIAQDPEIILLGDAAYGVSPESVAQRPGWEGLRAVQSGQVLPFDDNTVSRPTHRLVDALENLAKLIHPELFE